MDDPTKRNGPFDDRDVPSATDPDGKDKPRQKKERNRRAGLAILLVFLLVLAAVFIGGILVVSSRLDRIRRFDTVNSPTPVPREEETFETEKDDVSGEDTMAPEEVDWTEPTRTEEQNQTMKSRRVRNILLIGQDRRPGEGRARSDSMSSCSRITT